MKKPTSLKKAQADLEVEGERSERVMQSMTGQGKQSVGREDDFLDDGDGYT